MSEPTATPPEYLWELSVLVSEALDLCVRARKLDNPIPRTRDDPWMCRSATPALWLREQYDNDLAAWEAKARKALWLAPWKLPA
jgi:hypothetical protein